jgi:GNAT superfamily N-acetyltransferase
MSDEQRQTQREVLPFLFELHRQRISATYVCSVEGKPVASATAVFADAAVLLLGGAVLPEARGRGCYRALVQARWEDAAARGTPALVVQAGEMSQPILERLGFQQVATMRVLFDRFA